MGQAAFATSNLFHRRLNAQDMLRSITGSTRRIAAASRLAGSSSPHRWAVAHPAFGLIRQQQRDLTVKSLDHLVITCHDIDKTINFYTRLGMGVVEFGQGRKALEFGSQKINLHQKGKEL